MSHNEIVGDINHSPSRNEVFHQNQTLSTRSKLGITAFAIGGVAGIVIIGLGIASTFGPLGSTGFIASMVGGGMATAISLGGIVWIVIANKKSRENKPTIEEARDPVSLDPNQGNNDLSRSSFLPEGVVPTGNDVKPLTTKENIDAQSPLLGVPKPTVKDVSQNNKEVKNPLIAYCMKLYNAEQDVWVMIPTQSDVLSGKEATLGIGSTSYKGAGHFKIHISIHPMHMEKAIPIIIQTLYRDGMPTVGLKFQTKHMLSRDHQIGKEFALIFSAEAEESESCSHTIEQLLLTLHNLFQEQGVLPEHGIVLTSETREQIARLPAGIQLLEKRNLEQRKFDRQIPGSNYFYYRCEDYTAIADTENWALEMGAEARKLSKIILFSELDRILIQSPQIIHNPSGIVDPYLNVRITL